MSKERNVGIFVGAGLLISAAIVFMIGDQKQLFNSKVTYYSDFADVSGLKPGAPVRMGGVDIGTVAEVSHSKDANDTKVHVKFGIIKAEAARVRDDSIAKIVMKGFLGDKMVEFTSGSGKPVAADGMVKAEDPLDMSKYLAKFDSITNNADKTVQNLEVATRALGDPQVTADLKATVGNLRALSDTLARKDGPINKLLSDPNLNNRVEHILTSADQMTTQLTNASRDFSEIAARVKSGPGTAHELLYDEKMSNDVAGTAAEIHNSLEAVRKNNGLAHAVMYGDETGETKSMMVNLAATFGDIRAIVGQVRAGKGTLGAFLMDPSIYEDVKVIVGNVDRNQVLRALVRYSIKEDETRGDGPKHVKTPDVSAK